MKRIQIINLRNNFHPQREDIKQLFLVIVRMQSQKRQYWEKILLIVLMTLNIYLVVYSIVAILIGSLVVHDYELIDPTRLSSNESTQTLEQMFEKTKLSIGKIGSSILVIGLFSLGVAFIGLFGVIYKSRIAFITQSILLFLMLVGCIVSLAIFGQRVKDSRYIFKHK
ncbi:hypothetical protein SNEBB_007573, partial [Seison nebaliae]